MGVIIKLFQWMFLPWLTRKFKKLVAGAAGRQKSRVFFEVERKYRLAQDEFDEMPKRLKTLGFSRKSQATVVDTFLPAEKEGDMVRLREETSDGLTVTVITLKEWVQLPSGKERKERESDPIDQVSKDCLLNLGRRLAGNSELLSYSKERTTFGGYRDKRVVTVALDVASGLGQYSGTYIEVEVLVEKQEEVEEARDFVEKFARELIGSEREGAISYMEMLKRSRQELKQN